MFSGRYLKNTSNGSGFFCSFQSCIWEEKSVSDHFVICGPGYYLLHPRNVDCSDPVPTQQNGGFNKIFRKSVFTLPRWDVNPASKKPKKILQQELRSTFLQIRRKMLCHGAMNNSHAPKNERRLNDNLQSAPSAHKN